jgi:hypothetical protein
LRHETKTEGHVRCPEGAKPATAKTVDGLRDFEHAGEQLDPTSTTTAPRHQAAPLAKGEHENLQPLLRQREKVLSKAELLAGEPLIKCILFRDYETRSTLNLAEVGAWKYASHPTTDVWCCAYAVDDGPIKLWIPGDPIPTEFSEAAQNPDWLVSCCKWRSLGLRARTKTLRLAVGSTA